jgi:hypothetical protein
MAMDYTAAVYDYLRTLGNPGDEVRTEIRPWLSRTYGLDYRDAARVRRHAMRELKRRRLAERINTRGAYVRILA